MKKKKTEKTVCKNKKGLLRVKHGPSARNIDL